MSEILTSLWHQLVGTLIGVSIVWEAVNYWKYGFVKRKLTEKLLNEMIEKKDYCVENGQLFSSDTEIMIVDTIPGFLSLSLKYYIFYNPRHFKKMPVFRFSKNAKTIHLLMDTAPLRQDYLKKKADEMAEKFKEDMEKRLKGLKDNPDNE